VDEDNSRLFSGSFYDCRIKVHRSKL
jgi:hypothetical protein